MEKTIRQGNSKQRVALDRGRYLQEQWNDVYLDIN